MSENVSKMSEGVVSMVGSFNFSTMYGLIVEDNIDLARNLQDFLKKHGGLFDVCFDQATALKLSSQNQYNCVLLDLNLPDGDGLELVKPFKVFSPNVKIIAFSGLVDEATVLKAFELGVDDYVRKTNCGLHELRKRLELAIKNSQAPPPKPKEYEFQGIRFSVDESVLIKGDKCVHVTKIGRVILETLLEHSSIPVSQATLMKRVWGHLGDLEDPNLLQAHMSRLRKRLRTLSSKKLIITCPQVGYKIIT